MDIRLLKFIAYTLSEQICHTYFYIQELPFYNTFKIQNSKLIRAIPLYKTKIKH